MKKTKIEEFDKEFTSSEINRNRALIKSEKISALNFALDLKNSNGGMMDLQFFIQNEIIKNKFNNDEIGKSFEDTLRIVSKTNELIKSNQRILNKNYERIFKMILILQVLSGKRGFTIDKSFNSKFVRKNF